jgi:hypothetical protein
MSMMSKVIKGRGKILFYDEKDREKMNKKYPDIEFEKMNALTFTTTYKGNKQFEVEIKVEDTKIQCAFNKWAWPWKYGTKVELRLYFKDLKKKAITHITGGIQLELFKFFRYDYEKMIKDDPKLNKKKKQKSGKQTQKKSKKDKYICYTGIGSKKSGNHTKKEFLKVMNHNKYNFNEPVPKEVKTVDQWIQFSGAEKGKCKKDIKDEKISKKDKTLRNKYKKISRIDCAKKYPKSRDKTLKCLDYWKCIKQNENTQKCNNKRGKTLKYLEKKYPKEWSQYQNDFQTNPKLKY